MLVILSVTNVDGVLKMMSSLDILMGVLISIVMIILFLLVWWVYGEIQTMFFIRKWEKGTNNGLDFFLNTYDITEERRERIIRPIKLPEQEDVNNEN